MFQISHPSRGATYRRCRAIAAMSAAGFRVNTGVDSYAATSAGMVVGADVLDRFVASIGEARHGFAAPLPAAPPSGRIGGRTLRIVDTVEALHLAAAPILAEVASEVVERAVRAARADGSIDLRTGLALSFPRVVLGRLLGVAPEDRRMFGSWCDALLLEQLLAPRPRSLRAGHTGFAAYVQDQLDELRQSGALSPVLDARWSTGDEHEMLFDTAFTAQVMFLVLGTSSVIAEVAGSCLQVLGDDPDRYAVVRADARAAATVVADAMGRVAPIQVVARGRDGRAHPGTEPRVAHPPAAVSSDGAASPPPVRAAGALLDAFCRQVAAFGPVERSVPTTRPTRPTRVELVGRVA